MKGSANVFHVILGVLSVFSVCRGQDVIINDQGTWKGSLQTIIAGFSSFSSGTWNQTGANSGRMGIQSLGQSYQPAVAAVGMNDVVCTYNLAGGQTVTDRIQFMTAKQFVSVERIKLETQKVISDWETFDSTILGRKATATITLTGSVTDIWSKEESTHDTIRTTAGLSTSIGASTEISGNAYVGSVKLQAHVDFEISAKLEQEIGNRLTNKLEGQRTQGVGKSFVLQVSEGERLVIQKRFSADMEDFVATVYPDRFKDGVSDTGIQGKEIHAVNRTKPFVEIKIKVEAVNPQDDK